MKEKWAHKKTGRVARLQITGFSLDAAEYIGMLAAIYIPLANYSDNQQMELHHSHLVGNPLERSSTFRQQRPELVFRHFLQLQLLAPATQTVNFYQVRYVFSGIERLASVLD
jgi:hypothetical protein